MKHLYILILLLLVINFGCKNSRKVVGGQQGDQTKESADYSVNNGTKPIVGNISQGNDLSIFKNNDKEMSIKYISWENIVRFINYETLSLHSYDRITGDGDEYNGTYTLEVLDNITFLNVRFDSGINEKWLVLANGTLCDIYKSDGRHIHGVTGSVNRDEIISSWPGTIRASSYLVENDILYFPSNLDISYRTDKPWVDGVEGYGIGEKILFEKGYVPIPNGSMHISIGYISYDKPYLYNKNSRPKKIKLSVENKFSFVVDLRDTPHYQEIKFPSSINQEDTLVLEILDVYPGTKYEDTCINTILFEMTSGFYETNNYWD